MNTLDDVQVEAVLRDLLTRATGRDAAPNARAALALECLRGDRDHWQQQAKVARDAHAMAQRLVTRFRTDADKLLDVVAGMIADADEIRSQPKALPNERVRAGITLEVARVVFGHLTGAQPGTPLFAATLQAVLVQRMARLRHQPVASS